MLEPWNDASLLPPPVLTSHIDHNIDYQGLIYICKNITKVLSKQSPLHKEGAIFSRFLYKYDKKFRNDIGYRIFRKVNTALKKYLQLNLLKDVEYFSSVLPTNSDDEYLPSRQMLEYFMLRLITFSKIILRICVCSKQAAVFYLDRVKRGEAHWMSLMPYAILSRVWTISKVLLQHICNWYSSLYPFLAKLKMKGLPFLPANYEMPSSFDKWLDIDNIDCTGKFEWSQKKHAQFDLDWVDEDGDRFESILEYVSEINQEENIELPENIGLPDLKLAGDKINNIHINLTKSVDLGETISRDSFKKLQKGIPVPVARVQHSADRVTNKDSLQTFINTEEQLRNDNSSQSLTSHLSFMQWQSLKSSLQALLTLLSKDRKIQRKFQTIWKDKCLDYNNE